eukprot:CAMPEP_0184690238 /NCGR_PEP_ID=MMETSP0312-20130426/31111_1 /TAXON_ID=31354 /ORGANISM="Compsopogon coeruleus, Strain SAG 36.94" /LENGTH=252 /DNA_ID=CAMNT_0027147697 /DNA_START=66 /DNA_END=821 /DNA_ORIENTATION=-
MSIHRSPHASNQGTEVFDTISLDLDAVVRMLKVLIIVTSLSHHGHTLHFFFRESDSRKASSASDYPLLMAKQQFSFLSCAGIRSEHSMGEGPPQVQLRSPLGNDDGTWQKPSSSVRDQHSKKASSDLFRAFLDKHCSSTFLTPPLSNPMGELPGIQEEQDGMDHIEPGGVQHLVTSEGVTPSQAELDTPLLTSQELRAWKARERSRRNRRKQKQYMMELQSKNISMKKRIAELERGNSRLHQLLGQETGKPT